MYKIIRADKDTYITDKVIDTKRTLSGNVGNAATLNLFKLYGITSSGSIPNTELSRLLIHFDLDAVRQLITGSKLDISDPSFNCKLKLFDVYGGNPTPRNFRVVVHPLSKSFEEGLGRDIVRYSDLDTANFLSASRSTGWVLSGANAGGPLGTTVDYITSFVKDGVSSSLASSQLFKTGEEDLLIDVTTAMSATLANIIPNNGFRLAFTASQEQDTSTYFVKRFAARHAYDVSKHPQLIFKFDDSIIDDSTNLRVDTSGSLVLYNYSALGLANILSASTQITGSNSLNLRLYTQTSGGIYNITFPASQVKLGSIEQTGIYSASVIVNSSNSTVKRHLNSSGSISFTPIWESLDGTVGYHSGSTVTFYPKSIGSVNRKLTQLTVTAVQVPRRVDPDEEFIVRVNIFDETSPHIKLSRLPIELPGLTIRDVHYRVRDPVTNDVLIPFDTSGNSTRLSSDSRGMFFALDTGNLTKGKTYVIDALVLLHGEQQVHTSISPTFTVQDI